MKKILTIILAGAFFAACGGAAGIGGSPGLEVKSGGKDLTFAPKSSTTSHTVMTYSEAPRGDGIIRSKKGVSHSIFLTNFEIAPDDLMKLRTVTADGQTFVRIGFVGEEGTDEKTPVKIDTYSTKAEKFNKLDFAMISTFVDGKAKTDDFNLMSSMTKAEGELKITSVTDDAISGEINLSDGDKSIKGAFTAKMPKK